MSSTPSPGKEYLGRQDGKKTDIYAHAGVQESGIQYFHVGGTQTKPILTCLPIRESDRCRIMARMSPGSQKILTGTKWSETGYIPSFKDTDEILMKAAQRTYTKTHDTPD